jgi:hypothetical protein
MTEVNAGTVSTPTTRAMLLLAQAATASSGNLGIEA